MKRTRTRWTTDDDNTLIAMRGEGKTYKQVARKLKRSSNGIAARVRTLRNRHGDDVIHRGGAKQARAKLKAAKKANAEVLNKHMPLPTERTRKPYVTPPPRDGIEAADKPTNWMQSNARLTAELNDVRNLFRDASAENEKLTKRRDDLLTQLTEVGQELSNLRLELADKKKQLQKNAETIITMLTEKKRLKDIIVALVDKEVLGE